MTESRSAANFGRSSAMSFGSAKAVSEAASSGQTICFASDTVVGVGCAATNSEAAEQIRLAKGRDLGKPFALMFWSVTEVSRRFSDLPQTVQMALAALLPGPVMVVIDDSERRYPLAMLKDSTTVGIRVPLLVSESSARVEHPVNCSGDLPSSWQPIIQTSANLSGKSDVFAVSEVAPAIRAICDVAVEGSFGAGVSSTIVDLTRFELKGSYEILREGALTKNDVAELLKPLT